MSKNNLEMMCMAKTFSKSKSKKSEIACFTLVETLSFFYCKETT